MRLRPAHGGVRELSLQAGAEIKIGRGATTGVRSIQISREALLLRCLAAGTLEVESIGASRARIVHREPGGSSRQTALHRGVCRQVCVGAELHLVTKASDGQLTSVAAWQLANLPGSELHSCLEEPLAATAFGLLEATKKKAMVEEQPERAQALARAAQRRLDASSPGQPEQTGTLASPPATTCMAEATAHVSEAHRASVALCDLLGAQSKPTGPAQQKALELQQLLSALRASSTAVKKERGRSDHGECAHAKRHKQVTPVAT